MAGQSVKNAAEALAKIETAKAMANLDELLTSDAFSSDDVRIKLATQLYKLEAFELTVHVLNSISQAELSVNKKPWTVLLRTSKALQDWRLREISLWKLSSFESTKCNKYTSALLTHYRRVGNENAFTEVAKVYSDSFISDVLRTWELSDQHSVDLLNDLSMRIHTDLSSDKRELVSFILDALTFQLPLVHRASRPKSENIANPSFDLLLEVLNLCSSIAPDALQWEKLLSVIEAELLHDNTSRQVAFPVIRVCTSYALNAGKQQVAIQWIRKLHSMGSHFGMVSSLVEDFVTDATRVPLDFVNWREEFTTELTDFVAYNQRIDFLVWLSPSATVESPKHTNWLYRQWARVRDDKLIETLNALASKGRSDLAASLLESKRNALNPENCDQAEVSQMLVKAIENWQLFGGEMVFDAISTLQQAPTSVILKGAEIKALLGKHKEAHNLIDSLPTTGTSKFEIVRVCSRMGYSSKLDRIAADAEALAENLVKGDDRESFLDVLNTLIELGRIEIADELLAKFISERTSQVPNDSRHLEPADREIYRLFARTRELLDDFDGAITAYRQYALLGSQDSHYFTGLARCLFMKGHHGQALELIDKLAFRARDDGRKRFNHTAYHILLNLGNFEDAFEGYRHRPIVADLRKIAGTKVCLDRDMKLPSPTDRQIFLSEFGPGDELRCASLYEELSLSAKTTAVTCDPRLETILSYSFPTINFIPVTRWRRTMSNEVKFGDYPKRDRVGSIALAPCIDNHIMDALPNFGRASFVLESLSSYRKVKDDFHRRSYLKVTPDVQSFWTQRLAERAQGRIVVGLSWRSMLQSTARSIFYTGIEDWQSLFARPDVMVVNLQTGAQPDEIAFAKSAGGIEMFDDLDLKDDFMGVAALMRACDIVYAPATTALELAGAVGANAVLLSMNEYTRWRLQPDGRDIWHGSVTVRHRPANQRASDFVAGLCQELNYETLRQVQTPLMELGARYE
jgi:tetratricopeptide (TPR) repeat protein